MIVKTYSKMRNLFGLLKIKVQLQDGITKSSKLQAEIRTLDETQDDAREQTKRIPHSGTEKLPYIFCTISSRVESN